MTTRIGVGNGKVSGGSDVTAVAPAKCKRGGINLPPPPQHYRYPLVLDYIRRLII